MAVENGLRKRGSDDRGSEPAHGDEAGRDSGFRSPRREGAIQEIRSAQSAWETTGVTNAARTLHAGVPHAELRIEAGWGHCPQLDDPSGVTRLITTFADGLVVPGDRTG